jgi:hypothetical protein
MRKCPVMALSAILCKDYMSHKKIMKKAEKALEKDAKHYKVEEKEAKSAAKDLKKRVKKAHE